MCYCRAEQIVTEYYTTICSACGVERRCSISISPHFSNNQTLSVGYSRTSRFRIILDQLFNPLIFGKPNSRVLYKLSQLKKDVLTNGVDMIQWLTSLQISDKRYQCTHFYFMWYKRNNYVVPLPPRKSIIREIEATFSVLESNFIISKHASHSFFSYNWLLRKLLTNHPKLLHYLQFVKRIKCRHRYERYNMMYKQLMSVNNGVVNLGDVVNCQKPLDGPLGDDSQSQESSSSDFLSLLAKMYRSKQEPAA